MNKFSVLNFFDLAKFEFSEIFEDIEYVWEVIPRISKVVSKKTKNKKIIIGKGTKIHKSAVIEGPAIIGKNCVIGPHVFIRENCIISDNSHIGHAVEIKNSILFPKAILAHKNYVGDSIIGSNVNMSGGSMTANFRLDRKEIRIKDAKQELRTGLIKLGAIVGDDSFVGVNAVLNPGTILGKNTIVYPLTSVTGVHNDGTKIK